MRGWVRGLVLAVGWSVVSVVTVPAAETCPIDQTHAAWTSLLARRVRAGVVDYAGWKREDTTALEAYLATLSAACTAGYSTWSRSERLAFWINAYNASTVKLILDHYPLSSIRSIGLLPGAAFRKRFIPLPALKGGTVSLDDIEHGTVRPEFKDPRVHFALVCASKGCPPLRSEAYRGADLEGQLDDQARTFLRDRTKNRFDAGQKRLQLSSLFTWFAADFVAAAGSVPAFVAPFVGDADAAVVRDPQSTIEYLDYDWSLNGS
jgi:Protein of unknown function, DUF547